MKLVELTGVIVDYLRATIPNPHASGNWIYADFPREDATFPRISVTQVTGSLSPIGIGEYTEDGKYGQLASIDYDIDAWIKVEDRATIDATVYVGTKLRDKYIELIMSTLFKKKEDFFKTYQIIDLEFFGPTSVPLDEANMLHRKTVTIRLTFVWERD